MNKHIRSFLLNMINSAKEQNDQNILDFLKNVNGSKLLDLGCDDGTWTLKLQNASKIKDLFGVEIVKERGKLAEERGIKVSYTSLTEPLPYPDNYFDVVHSNQVIEHLSNTDIFLSESYRVLKPGGTLIVSTENLSSWHNVFALILGFQPFSMTNFSSKGNIGNPFALWNGMKSNASEFASWQHLRLFSYFGLADLLKKHGFKVMKIKTAGYYPLPNFIANIDSFHGHWIAILARK